MDTIDDVAESNGHDANEEPTMPMEREEFLAAVSTLARRISEGQSTRPPRLTDIVSVIIAGLVAIVSIGAMIWSFTVNQTTQAAVVSQKLDTLASTLAEIRKNADQVPTMQVRLEQLEKTVTKQGDQQQKVADQVQELHDTVNRMGVSIRRGAS